MVTVTTVKDSVAACSALSQQPAAWDVETCGVLGSADFCVLALAAYNGGEAYVWGREAIADLEIRQTLKDWLASNAPKFGQNIKFDMAAVRSVWGVEVRGIVGDTMLMHKLLHDDRKAGLDELSKLVGRYGYKGEFEEHVKKAKALITKARGKKGSQLVLGEGQQPLEWARKYRKADAEAFAYGLVPECPLNTYCANDSVTTYEVYHYLTKEMKGDCGVTHAWESIVKPATRAVERMEARGIMVDAEALGKFAAHIATKRDEVGSKLHAAGLLKPNSPKQVGVFLFGVLGLEPVRMKKTGPSTDKKTLEMLRQKHTAVGELLEYRRLDKLHSSYGESLVYHINADGRIRSQFRIDGARTGRMSCCQPNMQQIPSRSEEAKLLKDCFIAAPGCALVQADYSQLEIRIAAMLSQDPVMIDLLASGMDFHMETAKKICRQAWKIEPEQVEKKHRSAAKTIIFGLIYGKTDGGLASEIGCSRQQAYNLRRAILGEFKGLAAWSEQAINRAIETGYSRTWWMGKEARRRHIIGFEKEGWEGQRPRNQAVNSPVQGTASDFCLASVIELDRQGVPVVLTVHDSIIVECKREDIKPTTGKVREVMEQWPSNGVPIVVDIEMGERWGSLSKYEGGSL